MALNRKQSDQPVTLLDRIGCAAFSAITGLVLGAIIWWGLSWHFTDELLPFEPVVFFAAVMGCLGFALNDNALANIIGWLFDAILALFDAILALGR